MSDITDFRPPSKEEIEKATARQRADWDARADRYHRVFAQNEDGRKLLEEWVAAFCTGGFTSDEAGHTALAKAEARREFVGMIIGQINSVNRRA